MSKLKIKLHENNDAVVDRYADGSARAILGNQPLLPDYVGPMWDGDGLRYESPQVYRLMSL